MNSKPHVLIIDDDPIVHRILQVWLTKQGFEVLDAFKGEEGLELTVKNHPDLILLDIMMPEMDGFEVCRRIKAKDDTRDIPIIFISAKAESEDRVQGLELGASDYITKPLDKGEVIARIQLQVKLKRQEDQLREYAQNLEKMVEDRTRQLIHAERLASLGTLSAGIAHEINNPTTFIMGNLQITEDFWKRVAEQLHTHPQAKDDKKIAFILKEFPAMIEAMKSGAERISNIVAGLKTFARKDSSYKEKVNLHACIEEALNLTHNRLKYNIEVEKRLDENLPAIWGNAQQLSQVLVNLLLNAADAIGEKEGHIQLSSRQLEDGLVQVKISDDGVGMPPEIMEKIFDPFYTTKPLGQGTGLGLSISHGIIEDHQGTISLESQLNKGTTFVLSLPIEERS